MCVGVWVLLGRGGQGLARERGLLQVTELDTVEPGFKFMSTDLQTLEVARQTHELGV